MDLFGTLKSLEEQFTSYVLGLVHQYGDWGVLIGMFLESSIVPIPSEAILVGAGLAGLNPLNVAFYGSIGSTLGAIVGYYIGLLGGRRFIDKFGKYFFITQERVQKAEKAVGKHGSGFVLLARLVPIIPFKVFSIAAGMLKFNLPVFVVFTFFGTLVRAYVLASIGLAILQYQWAAVAFIAAFALLAVLLYFADRKYKLREKILPKKKA